VSSLYPVTRKVNLAPWNRHVARVERYEDKHWPRPVMDTLGGLMGMGVAAFCFVDHHDTWYFWVLLPVALLLVVYRIWRVNRDRLPCPQRLATTVVTDQPQ
jgi:hypothetical protein